MAAEQRSQASKQGMDDKCPVGEKSAAEYARLLLACGNAADYIQAKRIHQELKQVRSDLEQDCYIGNILVTMYGKCGKPRESQEAFDRILEPNVISWSSLIAVYAGQDTMFQESMMLFQRMQLEGVPPNNVTFVNLLKAFNSRHHLAQGKLLHTLILDSGYELDSFVGTTLMNMYGKCGSLRDARLVFESTVCHERSAPWSVLMAAYVSNGRNKEAVTTFYSMHLEGVTPDKIALINVMTACSTPDLLADASRIHACISEHECRTDAPVVNALLNMFGKCGGGVEKARGIFDCAAYVKTSASWNTMIGLYVELGFKEEAMVLFQNMLLDGASSPDEVSFARIFTACDVPVTLQGLVDCMTDAGIAVDVVIQTVLVKLYAEFGELGRARDVFDTMVHRDSVLWNVMITAHANHDDSGGAWLLFLQMLLDGQQPDRFTIVSALESYAGLDEKKKMQLGQLLGTCTVEAGVATDTLVRNAFISVHGKCGMLVEAERAFEGLGRDVVSWNAMLGAFAESGYWEEALHLLRRMQLQGEKPNGITLMAAATAVSCCSGGCQVAITQEGKKIHEWIRERGLGSSTQVSNSLIHMYARCWCARDAEVVFSGMEKRDVVSWTALLSAYDETSDEEDCREKAVACLQRMRLEGVTPSKVTLITALSIFAKHGNLCQGGIIHQHVRELGLEDDAEVASSLIDMYGECGRWEDSRRVFEVTTERDVVVWNALISACSKDVTRRDDEVVMTLLRGMLVEGCKPSRVTLAVVLDSLSESTALEQGRAVDRLVRELGLESDTGVATGLVSLYARCGKLAESSRHFERIAWHRSSSGAWNVFMAACARQGVTETVKSLFHRMQQQGVDPANCTFVSLLSACSHSGDLEGAWQAFRDMERDFGVAPSSIEKGCIVDLLGRSGRLAEAEELAAEVSGDAWSALLASCTLHGDVERGRQAGQRFLSESCWPPASTYVTLSNSIKAS
ncbi:pentatricopeptide repeat-containing protein At3g09040, mitochondrial [Selaginella moellendorffii]|nr:pentatricopeptide repeat-containing protein At3g09040, mitochondrial [Selaginella moellendorffii]|eukprot:XP_002994061.2 pentatricopeptide repeat-containing protein At3g09040, mitochondrial [Selaginella moellendorffii]